MLEEMMLNVRNFGAKGDGKTDDTVAIQKALDKAAEYQGTVFIPEGIFLSGELKVASHVGMRGLSNWSFQRLAGSIIKLNDPQAKGLLNLTGSLGVTIRELCLDGGKLPGQTHGILFDKPNFGVEEDTPRIEGCRVDSFSGDGVHLGRIWCFTIRHCHFFRNGGCGVYLHGWDGFLLDNWFTCNGLAGFGGYRANYAVTFSGNRVEWNVGGGLVSYGGKNYNITGNYFDRSYGPAISLLPRGETPCSNFSIIGNLLHRSGKPEPRKLEQYESSHARFEGAQGVVFTGNTLVAGRDDKQQGVWSPNYGIVCKGLSDSIIKDNVMHQGATKELLVDLGDHSESVIIKDNVGSLKIAEPEVIRKP